MDGGGSSATTNQDMITAINDGTNGILLDAIDSTTVLQGMEAAKAANVPVISAIADSPVGTAPSDVYSEISGQTVQSGVDIADLFIVLSKGKAQVASFHVSSIASTVNRYKGFKAEMKKCSGCKIVSDQTYGLVSQADFESLIKATLAAHPSIKYIFVDISQYATIAAQALQQLGLQHKVGVAGVDCLAPETQSIAQRTGEVGCAEDAIQFAGGPVVNEFTRAFAGLTAENEAVPLRLLTRQIITSEDPPYLGGFNLLTHYESLWGLG
jgi:ribose transport system substrate-binding protein